MIMSLFKHTDTMDTEAYMYVFLFNCIFQKLCIEILLDTQILLDTTLRDKVCHGLCSIAKCGINPIQTISINNRKTLNTAITLSWYRHF
jgi:hypothetical protein